MRLFIFSDEHCHIGFGIGFSRRTPGGDSGNLIPAQYLAHPFHEKAGGFGDGAQRNDDRYYSIPILHVNAHIFEGPLRTSSLRSLGGYANIFAMGSFMDELAEMAKTDPFEFRFFNTGSKRYH